MAEGPSDGEPPEAGEATELVVIPRHFEDAGVDDIVVLVAEMLERLALLNDQIVVPTANLTRFHSRIPPTISILDYLRRIVQFTKPERACLLLTLHYVDLVCSRNPNFALSSLTVHRFLMAAIVCSSKALCDVFCKNTHYARVGGLSLEEMNLLEREFLGAIDWRLATTRELIQQYYDNLVHAHPRYTFPPGEPTSSSSSDAGTDSSSAGHSSVQSNL